MSGFIHHNTPSEALSVINPVLLPIIASGITPTGKYYEDQEIIGHGLKQTAGGTPSMLPYWVVVTLPPKTNWHQDSLLIIQGYSR